MPQEMIRVGLVGVTGYTGMELARLLTGHPNMKLTAATSRTEAGKRLGDLYPFLNGLREPTSSSSSPNRNSSPKECDLAFLAVPHTAATEMAAALVERGLKVVDLSADFPPQARNLSSGTETSNDPTLPKRYTACRNSTPPTLPRRALWRTPAATPPRSSSA